MWELSLAHLSNIETGKIIFDISESKNKSAVQNRKLESGEMINYGETLLRNELNVLLTRGVNGLYVYAVDEELQQALKNATKLRCFLFPRIFFFEL